jgi:hypothetical protein
MSVVARCRERRGLRWPPAGDVGRDDIKRLDPRFGFIAADTDGTPSAELEPLRGAWNPNGLVSERSDID